jgi:hypothetical protein
MQKPVIDSPVFTPLALETRPTVSTNAAAFYLNRKPHTLHCWATYQNGAVNPRRVGGRLHWAVADIRAALGEAA